MPTKKDTRYIETIGRRKTATARVRVFPGTKANKITVNNQDIAEYFDTTDLQNAASQAITDLEIDKNFEVTVVVKGGGVRSQAEAVRHGISRALVEFDAELRAPLKKSGFLKRDPRKKERKKPGLKKARKAPQWSKR